MAESNAVPEVSTPDSGPKGAEETAATRAGPFHDRSTESLPAGDRTDALIAERVFGWRWAPDGDGGGTLWMPDGQMAALWYPGDVIVTSSALPHYSTDIAAAWLVVERLRSGDAARSWTFELRDNSEHGGPEEWLARFIRYDAALDEQRAPESWTCESAAPLAICRAALLANAEAAS